MSTSTGENRQNNVQSSAITTDDSADRPTMIRTRRRKTEFNADDDKSVNHSQRRLNHEDGRLDNNNKQTSFDVHDTGDEDDQQQQEQQDDDEHVNSIEESMLDCANSHCKQNKSCHWFCLNETNPSDDNNDRVSSNLLDMDRM